MEFFEKTNKNKEKKSTIKSNPKIKKEKSKIKTNKKDKLYTTKPGKVVQKSLFSSTEKESKPPTLKSQILSIIIYEIVGAFICLLVLYIITGGKNYFKLYYELNKLIDTYDTITSEYYGEMDKKELIDSAIASMISETNDNFTNYNDKETADEFLETVSGTYEGIGATVKMDENQNIVIAEVMEDSPSEKAGLKAQDIILKADGKEYKDNSSLADYIKNCKKDQIVLTISRENIEQEITILRQEIETQTVTTKIIERDNKKLGYIKISIFTSITTKQFKEKLKDLEQDNIEGLIIDVRSNNGGYLSTVTDITSLFLEKGKIIYQLKDKNKIEKIKDETKEKRTYPIAVLVNKSSASASEILASAIKESYNGHVIGTNTYGKGTVQKTKTLKDGSMIKYTVQNWLTPNGNWINEVGLEPTIKVELDLSLSIDTQLETGVETLLKDLNK